VSSWCSSCRRRSSRRCSGSRRRCSSRWCSSSRRRSAGAGQDVRVRHPGARLQTTHFRQRQDLVEDFEVRYLTSPHVVSIRGCVRPPTNKAVGAGDGSPVRDGSGCLARTVDVQRASGTRHCHNHVVPPVQRERVGIRPRVRESATTVASPEHKPPCGTQK